MTRRRPRWGQVATMARTAEGAWRLHPDLAGVNFHLMRHAQRRVRPLRPTAEGHFEFARGGVGEDELGRRIFDLYVRYATEGDTDD